MEIYFIKKQTVFIPDPADDYSKEKFAKIKHNEVVKVTIVRPRNVLFHRKFFKLLDIAFDNWNDSDIVVNEIRVKVTRESFRKKLIIWAGYYEEIFYPDGTSIIEAKSISFASMKQDEFEGLFSNMINVILERFCTNYTEQDLRDHVDQILNFA
jgi:hypothetical protein